MWTFSIVPHKPINELAVENNSIHKFSNMIINKLILNRSVKPFAVSVHLWGLGICVVVSEMKLLKLLGKMFGKL